MSEVGQNIIMFERCKYNRDGQSYNNVSKPIYCIVTSMKGQRGRVNL